MHVRRRPGVSAHAMRHLLRQAAEALWDWGPPVLFFAVVLLAIVLTALER